MYQRISSILSVIALAVVTACASAPTAPSYSASAAPAQSAVAPGPQDIVGNYRLGVGDQIRLIVFDENDLSGTFTVDDSGQLSLPLVGQVSAEGLDVSALEKSIAAELRQGYLRNPRVSIEVLRYRPFYISGEVEGDGEYPYVVGLTVPQAIATAGGYTRRANKNIVVIVRAGSTQRYQYPADQTTLVYPGDVIQIPERFF